MEVTKNSFTILMSSSHPTPAVNLVDHKLVSELKLKMFDLQCRRFHFGGQKLRILGKVSTSVQCIIDGKVLGNLHFKASIVENLYEYFDSHSVAGDKLSQVLSTPEPQTPQKTIKKRKKNVNLFNSPTSTNSSAGHSHHNPNKFRRPTSTNSQNGDSYETDDNDDWAEDTLAVMLAQLNIQSVALICCQKL